MAGPVPAIHALLRSQGVDARDDEAGGEGRREQLEDGEVHLSTPHPYPLPT